MDIKGVLEAIDNGWIKKPKGFSLRFEESVDSEMRTDYVPELDAALLDSDVVSWRLAWKLAKVDVESDEGLPRRRFSNITVVNDEGEAIRYYLTNEYEIFNRLEP